MMADGGWYMQWAGTTLVVRAPLSLVFIGDLKAKIGLYYLFIGDMKIISNLRKKLVRTDLDAICILSFR